MRMILVSLLLSSSLFAQDLPEAATIMERVAEAREKRLSLQYTIEANTTQTQGAESRTRPSRATVTVVAPGKYRVEEVDGSGPGERIHVSDGATSWDYIAATKQYSKTSAGQLVDDLLGIPTIEWFGAPPGSSFQGQPRTLREETIEVDGKKYDSWVITDALKPGTLAARISNATIVSWISKEYLVPVRNELSLSLSGNSVVDITSVILLRAIKVNEPIAADAFTFTPPPDAREISVRPRLDLSGSPAPKFEAKDLEGKSYSLSTLKGKPVLLDFFTTWCRPCAESAPTLERIHGEFKDKGLVVLAVDVDEPRSVVDAFLKPRPMPYPVIMGTEFGVDRAFQVSVFPTFILIDAEGKVAGQFSGWDNSSEATLREMLAKIGLRTAPAARPANAGSNASSAPYSPAGVALDSGGNLYVADAVGGRIIKVPPSGPPSIVAGTGVSGSGGDSGMAVYTPLHQPSALAMDAGGNLYIVETGNGRIRKMKPDGSLSTVTTVQGQRGGSMALDAAGSLYVTTGNRVQKVLAGGTTSVFAGSGVPGFQGDGGSATAAQLNNPSGVALDAAGNLYIADTRSQRVRKVTAGGTIFLAAGNGSEGFSGDRGLAVLAQLKNPSAVAVDRSGNLYIADAGNYRIRKVATDGTITTIAGTGVSGFAGDGGPALQAQFGAVTAMAVDNDGNLYIADTDNQRIRRIATDGKITTVPGTTPDVVRQPPEDPL